MIMIKANKNLFDQWSYLSARLDLCKAIVQNDMEVDEREVLFWKGQVDAITKEIHNLMHQTLKYVFDKVD